MGFPLDLASYFNKINFLIYNKGKAAIEVKNAGVP